MDSVKAIKIIEEFLAILDMLDQYEFVDVNEKPESADARIIVAAILTSIYRS